MQDLKRAAAEFRSYSPQAVLVVHHNDTDGLTSGAIVTTFCERMGISVARYCLEKPYPSVVERLLSDPFPGRRGVAIFTDFASGILPMLSTCNVKRVPLLVLDHHEITPTTDPYLRLVNPRAFGLPGDTECSASAVCALFAMALDPRNGDLARLGVLGAIGDGMISETGTAVGLNEIVAEEARARGDLINHRGNWIRFQDGSTVAAEDLRTYVDALGSAGYFSGGPDVAMKGLLEGFDSRYVHLATVESTRLRTVTEQFFATNAIKSGSNLDWFVLDERFSSFGVKTVGLLCESVASRGPDTARYILGFQALPNEVPGIGPIALGQVKLSMRVTRTLRTLIQQGAAPALRTLVKIAAEPLNGFVDACHDYAGAATIRPDSIDSFIENVRSQIARVPALRISAPR